MMIFKRALYCFSITMCDLNLDQLLTSQKKTTFTTLTVTGLIGSWFCFIIVNLKHFWNIWIKIEVQKQQLTIGSSLA